jgi:hypothetical protein
MARGPWHCAYSRRSVPSADLGQDRALAPGQCFSGSRHVASTSTIIREYRAGQPLALIANASFCQSVPFLDNLPRPHFSRWRVEVDIFSPRERSEIWTLFIRHACLTNVNLLLVRSLTSRRTVQDEIFDRRVRRGVSLAESPARKSSGTWKLDGTWAFCASWKRAETNCYAVVPSGNNKWSIQKASTAVAVWCRAHDPAVRRCL